jgi:hypothetical protein
MIILQLSVEAYYQFFAVTGELKGSGVFFKIASDDRANSLSIQAQAVSRSRSPNLLDQTVALAELLSVGHPTPMLDPAR